MTRMTSRERIARMYQHRPADRIPITDEFWGTTLRRWRAEGLPEGVDVEEYLDIDKFIKVTVDTSPRMPARVIEETDEYRISTTRWGATMKTMKVTNATPEMIRPGLEDITDWPKFKERITPDPDRIDWKQLETHYASWREKGWWVAGQPWFGFDISHAGFTGTENMLVAMLTDPEIVRDMFEHQLDISLALLEMAWDRGFTFDGIRWPDDMGYKYKQFFSPEVYRTVLKPVHKRAIEWAHARDIPAHLHSCGDVRPLVPELLEIGLDALNPLEVKAGMDPLELKDSFGDRLLLHGGINAVLWTDPDAVHAEIDRLVPRMMEHGGYIFSSDHSVPDAVSFETFREIVEHAKRAGSYE